MLPPLAPADLASATPTETARARAKQAHFNASLDEALHRLECQKSGTVTPPSDWALPAPVADGDLADGDLAADDLVTDASTCCASRASSATPSGPRPRAAAAAAAAKPPPPAAQAPVSAECQVRARIPYPGGHFYLHVYRTSEDAKEHLAIVFGDDIRSATLEAPRDGESDMDRKIRGAATGPLRRLVAQDIAARSSPDAAPREPPALGGFDLDPAEEFAAARLSVVDAPLVRVHSECFTGETVSSVRCDCGYQLAEAMRLIQQEGRGVIVYLRQEGRGIGLLEKLKAYNLQDMGHDTLDANLLLNHPADARTYGAARAILADLGIPRLRLLTNNSDKIRQLRGLDVVCHVPMPPRWWAAADDGDGDGDSSCSDAIAQLPFARHLLLGRSVMSEADRYLRTKAERMGHMLAADPAALTIPRMPTSALYVQDV
ncbi:GTP cyclohydrolase II [Coemansia javaensis]|uniref:GTP cyclohydrolase II n=1 Tax=Coemansia javaensis TaxID=2761396 RepID=A0A9W8H706_9FUNG|nr:GTP cyclohydrolase II [Coemansia javaensis]